MSFAAYKDWAIPEGKVKQVTDEAGNVLWSAVPPVAVITINCSSEHSSGTAYVQIDGTTYNQNSGKATIEVPIGTTITCGTQAAGSSYYGGNIYLNGTSVSSGYSNTYPYTVNGNVTIVLENDRVNDFSSGSSTPKKKDYSYVYINET